MTKSAMRPAGKFCGPGCIGRIVNGAADAAEGMHPLGQVMVVLAVALPFKPLIMRLRWMPFRQFLADPLGLGGLLIDAYRVQQLMQQGAVPDPQLLDRLLRAALAGLQHYAESGELRLPLEYRLAFRELGLAIGLHAVERMWQAANQVPRPSFAVSAIRDRLQALMRFSSLRDEIESFWRNPEHRRSNSWSEHMDINEVMLATSLAPEGFLVLAPPR